MTPASRSGLARRCGGCAGAAEAIIWLNPLIGWRDYSPQARGMQAALPYVDLFAPAHNLRKPGGARALSREDLIMSRADDILDIIATRRSAGEPFALATVVRTVAATAAKAGAKAVIRPTAPSPKAGSAAAAPARAVLKAAQEALADGRSRLVSVQPPDVLADRGVKPGEEHEGVRFANNMCPSQGTMDIFVEPVLPRPQVVICGSSPVAVAIADLARRTGFAVTVCAPAAEQGAFGEADRRIEGYALPVEDAGARYVVVSTQGRGDEAALLAALAVDADYVAFVGSRKKAEALKATLATRGVAAERLATLKAPAGLDLGAITPDEIAISILAEIVAVRRSKHSRETCRAGDAVKTHALTSAQRSTRFS